MHRVSAESGSASQSEQQVEHQRRPDPWKRAHRTRRSVEQTFARCSAPAISLDDKGMKGQTPSRAERASLVITVLKVKRQQWRL